MGEGTFQSGNGGIGDFMGIKDFNEGDTTIC